MLLAADGATNAAMGRTVGTQADTARLWRGRWHAAQEVLLAAEAEGDDGALRTIIGGLLQDDPRPGAPATFAPEQVCQIIALACEPPGGTTKAMEATEATGAGRPLSHWTPRELADEAIQRGIVSRISPQSVERFLKGGRPAAPPNPVLAHAGPR